MTARPLGLFDQEIRQRKLQALGDPLVAAEHHRALGHVPRDAADDAHGGPGSAQGRPPPHDAVRMFKVLVQRELYARSDEQVEYPTADRLSFQRFLGIDLAQEAPDYTAIWRFRERLGAARMKALFEELGAYIDLAGFEARKSPMLDASLVQKPKTRKPAEPKDGEPELTRQQAAHRDGEANWTQKYDRSWFGYKNHINADVMHGFIRDYAVTPAATHDSQALPELLDITQRGQPLYAELGEDPRAGRTRIRAPRPVPKGRLLRCTGLARAAVVIGLINFAHNLRRLVTMARLQQQAHVRERMRSAHRERAPGAGPYEVQDEADGNSNDILPDAPCHAIDQAACGKFKTGSSNCSLQGLTESAEVVICRCGLRMNGCSFAVDSR